MSNAELSDEQKKDIHLSRETLNCFFSVIRSALYHSTNNAALDAPAAGFSKAISWLLKRDQGESSIVVGDGNAFVGANRVRCTKRELEVIAEFSKFLAPRGLGGFTFSATLDVEQVRTFAGVLVNLPASNDDRGAARFDEAASAAGLGFVRAIGRVEGTTEEAFEALEFDSRPAAVCHQLSLLAGALMHDPDAPLTQAAIRQSLRSLGEAGVQSLQVAFAVLGLAPRLRPHELGIGAAVLAALLAQKLGLGRAASSELSAVALAAVIAESPDEAARRLLSGPRVTLAQASQALALFQCSGRLGERKLYAQVTEAISRYVRAVLGEGMLPHLALHALSEDRSLDRSVVGALVQSVGVVPVGSIVKSSGELGVVVELTTSPSEVLVRFANESSPSKLSIGGQGRRIDEVGGFSGSRSSRRDALLGEDAGRLRDAAQAALRG